MPIHIAIDIGGTKMMTAAVDAETRILRSTKRFTPLDLAEGLAQLHDMIAEVAAGETIAGIGMSIGGPIDLAAGTVSPLNQPQWRDVPMRRLMADRWGVPFHYGVDTDVAAVGEYYLAQLSVARFLYVTVSTGVGGGFLLDGKVYRGLQGIHPEVGHTSLRARVRHPERVRCGCGNDDCLEALVSGSGIEKVYGKPAAELQADEWDEVAWNLAQGLRNMIMVLSPDLIVLGGGVTIHGGAYFLDQMRAYLRERLTLAHMPEIRVSELGYETALLGAACLARGLGTE